MALFSKEPNAKPFPEKIAKRVSKIPTGELEQWIDQCLFDVGRLLTLYGKHRDNNYLKELLIGAEALHAVVDELNNRMTRK